ncbi:HET-domain-containing protein, partial [Setomelanomma holmii]
FRLLRILPSLKRNVVIECEMFDSFIGEQDFVAGSYVWGPPEPTHPIIVNDALVHVRQNLFDFLRASRRPLQKRVIWIGALCINQNDNDEKSHQVQAMDHIYRQATAVYSWL